MAHMIDTMNLDFSFMGFIRYFKTETFFIQSLDTFVSIKLYLMLKHIMQVMFKFYILRFMIARNTQS